MKIRQFLTAAPLVAFLTLGAFALTGCEEEGAAEKLGKQLDDAVDEVGEKIEKATE